MAPWERHGPRRSLVAGRSIEGQSCGARKSILLDLITCIVYEAPRDLAYDRS